jgi:hypothetical protein
MEGIYQGFFISLWDVPYTVTLDLVKDECGKSKYADFLYILELSGSADIWLE